MVYITGDIHGDVRYVEVICQRHGLSSNDTLVLLGDVGANYYLGKRDVLFKQYIAELAPTILCIHGNHEARPQTVPGYLEKRWQGGKVYYQEEYPKLLFAQDGEMFYLEGYRCLVIGGAYSVDKYYRQSRGWAWWPDEQPSEETKAYVERQVQSNPVDIVLSHTCPAKYTPTECFLPGLPQSTVDKSTEEWLDKVEDALSYDAWFCGHWHTDKRIDKMHFLYHDCELLQDIVLSNSITMGGLK